MKTILVFVLFISCLTQGKMKDVSIENIKESYSVKDTLQVILTNKEKGSLFYYIGIECNINNEWREVVNDINNPKSKASVISQLRENEKKDVSFLIEKVLKDFVSNFDTYRLKINYGSTVEALNRQDYSQPFKVLK